jgi:hypothetical protein
VYFCRVCRLLHTCVLLHDKQLSCASPQLARIVDRDNPVKTGARVSSSTSSLLGSKPSTFDGCQPGIRKEQVKSDPTTSWTHLKIVASGENLTAVADGIAYGCGAPPRAGDGVHQTSPSLTTSVSLRSEQCVALA